MEGNIKLDFGALFTMNDENEEFLLKITIKPSMQAVI